MLWDCSFYIPLTQVGTAFSVRIDKMASVPKTFQSQMTEIYKWEKKGGQKKKRESFTSKRTRAEVGKHLIVSL